MTSDRWIVTFGGLALVAFIIWFFWLKRSTGSVPLKQRVVTRRR